MKQGLFCVLMLTFYAQVIWASSLTTRVLEVIPTQSGIETMVLAEDEGRVIWVDSRDEGLVNALEHAKKNQNHLRLDFNEESGDLLGVELLETSRPELTASALIGQESYNATVMASKAEAQVVFDDLDRNIKRWAQCFNRAHVWSFDMWRKKDVYSMKMFLFFTRRFIEENRYKWWFHVAPYVLANTDQGIQEKIMDASFTQGPTDLKVWTDYFMNVTKPVCPRVTWYSEFRDNQMTQDCYLISANMYYRSPRDLELLETKGRQELGWSHDEVREARKQAFKNWRDFDI